MISVAALTKALESGKTVTVIDSHSDGHGKVFRSAYRLDDKERGIVTVAIYTCDKKRTKWIIKRNEDIMRLKLSSCIDIIMREHFEGCEVKIK